jgi:hypothetical protein
MNFTGITTVCLFIAFFTGATSIMAGDDKSEDKNITLISAQSTADGKSKVWKELLEECIVSLPKVAALEAEVSSQTHFLKEINGKKGKNEHMKTYSASIEINYMIYQKRLMIITTSSVQGQEPVIKEVEGKIKKSKKFVSNSGDGDLHAGQSKRKHYFSSAEKAVADVKARAGVWLKQQSAVVCSDK